MQKHSFKIYDPTQIYYNIDIVNNDTSNEGKQLSLEFDETRTGDFLKNPGMKNAQNEINNKIPFSRLSGRKSKIRL